MDNNHLTRIETPEDIAKSGNGQGPYVIFRTRFKGKYRNVFYEVADLARQIQELPKTKESVAEATALLGRLREKKALLTEAYTELVVDWNWIGDDGELLPKPTIPGVIEGELYPDQENWISDQLRLIFKHQATEGKKTNGESLPTG